MRKLIYVPIIHTEADLGSMAGILQKEFEKKYDQQKWKVHLKAIDEMWQGISEKIIKLNLDWRKVRVYQDGLPLCGREAEIVTDLAKNGSVNHRIVLDLFYRGAKLEGSEDSNLLLQEYKFLQKIAQAKTTSLRKKLIEEYNQASRELLIKRDQFIANRIDQTLDKKETGILFIGLMHQVDRFLPDDIMVSFLIHRLPFGEDVRSRET